jgi:hypothetical protein
LPPRCRKHAQAEAPAVPERAARDAALDDVWGRDDATLHVLVGDPFAVLACEPVAEDFVHAGELEVDSDALVIIADYVPGTNSTAAATSR